MKKGMLIYAIFAAGLIFITGILAMLLGFLQIFPGETNQYIIETISGYLGAAFFTCFLMRLKTKQWEEAWEKTKYLHVSVVAFLLFLCRLGNRFILGLFLKQEMPGAGYTISVLIDIALMVGLYFCLPKSDSETTGQSKKKEQEQAAGEEK